MESRRNLKALSVDLAHLPTAMLVIGYAAYWIELYFLAPGSGHTSWLWWAVFGALGVGAAVKEAAGIRQFTREAAEAWRGQGVLVKLLVGTGLFLSGIFLAISFRASLLPPHLPQETDVLTYHIGIPRQHLLRDSFAHIKWSTADLYSLPLDFALAPYWLATSLPNKFPQFFFLAGLIGVCLKIVRRFSPRPFLSMAAMLFAVTGSHSVMIQAGTGMLDIAMCYLLIAALDSFLQGKMKTGILEFTFYFWSKSFIPIQAVLIFLFVVFLVWVLKRAGGNPVWFSGRAIDPRRVHAGKAFILFLLFSLGIGGPFAAKTLYYAGTPLFPFKPGLMMINRNIDKNSAAWQSIEDRARRCVAIRDDYGSGRSLKDFLIHWWLIAVPEKDVNNRYDYPVGLVYLLFLGPFVVSSAQSLRRKEIPLIPLVIAGYWITWWMGSQQSRFLFIPLILMFMAVAAQPRYLTRVLLGAMLAAVALTSLSMARAHKRDFGKRGYEVLRKQDQKLVDMSEAVKGKGVIEIDIFEIAFADFPVKVVTDETIFVLKTGD